MLCGCCLLLCLISKSAKSTRYITVAMGGICCAKSFPSKLDVNIHNIKRAIKAAFMRLAALRYPKARFVIVQRLAHKIILKKASPMPFAMVDKGKEGGSGIIKKSHPSNKRAAPINVYIFTRICGESFRSIAIEKIIIPIMLAV